MCNWDNPLANMPQVASNPQANLLQGVRGYLQPSGKFVTGLRGCWQPSGFCEKHIFARELPLPFNPLPESIDYPPEQLPEGIG